MSGVEHLTVVLAGAADELQSSRIIRDSFKLEYSRDSVWDLFDLQLSFDYLLYPGEKPSDLATLGALIEVQTGPGYTAFWGRMEAPAIVPQRAGRSLLRVRAIGGAQVLKAVEPRSLLPDPFKAGSSTRDHLIAWRKGWMSARTSDMSLPAMAVIPSGVVNFSAALTAAYADESENLYTLLRMIGDSSGMPYLTMTTAHGEVPQVKLNASASADREVIELPASTIPLTGEWRMTDSSIRNRVQLGVMKTAINVGKTGQAASSTDYWSEWSLGESIAAVGLREHQHRTVWAHQGDDSMQSKLFQRLATNLLDTRGPYYSPATIEDITLSPDYLPPILAGATVYITNITHHRAMPYKHVRAHVLGVSVEPYPLSDRRNRSLKTTLTLQVYAVTDNTETPTWGDLAYRWASSAINWSN